ncbi:IS66 family insertion sequence element accessory protein TnpB [Vibrio cholerae]|uniref:IS66 family insertion sequence element accessory protein TnpA n=1 Tax=Vibrio paracholerae TaxID=650003 RepID=UPI00209616DD|nr:IS66 family insertion sequence element accessory protein TnpB [Vibrio paracholerae]MCO7021325.1 IS66 family insertion sequence element accessory protein TnpB [Vibrio paracholerae]HDL9436180.1 IS66 family insertion sequence element accessory protein TnpB [Vibrio cholerae]
MAKRRTNQEWRTLFEHYESSQLSQRLFCERNGLSLSTFYAKRQQLKHIEKPNTVGFIKAEVVEKTTKYQSQTATANMTLLINDIELSIPQGTPATYLAELIGALS